MLGEPEQAVVTFYRKYKKSTTEIKLWSSNDVTNDTNDGTHDTIDVTNKVHDITAI